MANTTTVEDLKTLVAEMMKRRGEEDYELDLGGNSKAGDGYMGEMMFFKIISKRNGKPNHLVLKSAPKNDRLRKLTFMEISFDRELYMYNTIFPSMKSFISTKNNSDSLLKFIPRLYWYSAECKKEALILENLKESGFVMWNRTEPLDFENTKFIFNNLAKWHGVVMAYRDQNSATFDSWVPHLYDIRNKILKQVGLIDHARKFYNQVVRFFMEKGQHELGRKYEALEENIEQFLQPAMEKNDRLVITHGDFWINNLMFKYCKDNSKVFSECKFIDFQGSTLNTPVEDLSFIVYTSCDKDVLDKLDILLQEYHSTLSTTIRSLGSNPDTIFTFKQLQEHWKKYGMLGVLTAIEILKLQHFTDDEAPDLVKICESGQTKITEYLDIEIRHQKLYFERLLTVFSSFGNKYL